MCEVARKGDAKAVYKDVADSDASVDAKEKLKAHQFGSCKGVAHEISATVYRPYFLFFTLQVWIGENFVKCGIVSIFMTSAT